jgi:SAM-dependent methyltransferase
MKDAGAADGGVLAHHKAAAGLWSLGGEAYNDISFGISDALAHAAQRLNPTAGEEILDVATGTGWSARNVARAGARVTAVDIAADLLAAAQELSAHVRPPITFRLADAENLPFADGVFDGVISTFGVMFAQNQQQAAAELGRVCRKGGRLALATWTRDGAVAQFFGVIGKYSDAPPPAVSPLAWGDPEHVTSLLGRDFDLKFEPGISNAYYPDTQTMWDIFTSGFGPIRGLAESLAPTRLAAFRRDMDAYHDHYATDAGLHVKREYLVTIGRRR